MTDAEDSCSGDECTCTVDGISYTVDQGRVALKKSSSSANDGTVGGPTATEGFGLHLVNCSTNTYAGGLSTAQIESYFEEKVGDMTSYDSFMGECVFLHVQPFAYLLI